MRDGRVAAPEQGHGWRVAALPPRPTGCTWRGLYAHKRTSTHAYTLTRARRYPFTVSTGGILALSCVVALLVNLSQVRAREGSGERGELGRRAVTHKRVAAAMMENRTHGMPAFAVSSASAQAQ